MGMKQDRYAIGLDLGTSAVKAVLFSPEKGVAAKGSGAFTYAPFCDIIISHQIIFSNLYIHVQKHDNTTNQLKKNDVTHHS